MSTEKTVVVVMGVAGSGKSTIAELIAHELGWTITEADDLHSPENVAKMAAGIPLNDTDREPWLRLHLPPGRADRRQPGRGLFSP